MRAGAPLVSPSHVCAICRWVASNPACCAGGARQRRQRIGERLDDFTGLPHHVVAVRAPVHALVVEEYTGPRARQELDDLARGIAEVDVGDGGVTAVDHGEAVEVAVYMRMTRGIGEDARQFRIAFNQTLVRGEDHVVEILCDQLLHDLAAPAPPRRAVSLPVRVVQHHGALLLEGQFAMHALAETGLH